MSWVSVRNRTSRVTVFGRFIANAKAVIVSSFAFIKHSMHKLYICVRIFTLHTTHETFFFFFFYLAKAFGMYNESTTHSKFGLTQLHIMITTRNHMRRINIFTNVRTFLKNLNWLTPFFAETELDFHSDLLLFNFLDVFYVYKFFGTLFILCLLIRTSCNLLLEYIDLRIK